MGLDMRTKRIITEVRALRNRVRRWVKENIAEIKATLPFPLLRVGSDNCFVEQGRYRSLPPLRDTLSSPGSAGTCARSSTFGIRPSKLSRKKSSPRSGTKNSRQAQDPLSAARFLLEAHTASVRFYFEAVRYSR
jgi:hypothetical protein